jgi:ABC-type cobalamin/Fe3+-siderophores transport system ATPase subunit
MASTTIKTLEKIISVQGEVISASEQIIEKSELALVIYAELLNEKEQEESEMVKVKDIVKQSKETETTETATVNWRLTKEHKREKIKRIINDCGVVSFVVKTPGSSHGDPVQAVILRDACVKRTKEGKYIVTGRDLEEEERLQLSADHARRPYKSRPKKEMVFRAYRIDRIVNKTIS